MKQVCHFINLRQSKDRLEHIENKIKSCGLRPSRFPAIHGTDIKPDECFSKSYKPLLHPDLKEEEISKAFACDIACKLSHCLLWRLTLVNPSLREEDYILVMEDDANPVPKYRKKLKAVLLAAPKDWDFIYLSHNKLIGKQISHSILKPRNTKRLGYNALLVCLLYTSPSPRDAHESRMPSSA